MGIILITETPCHNLTLPYTLLFDVDGLTVDVRSLVLVIARRPRRRRVPSIASNRTRASVAIVPIDLTH